MKLLCFAALCLCLNLVATRLPAAKDEVWVEVRSPNFIVVSNAGEKQARRVADQFEQFRATFQSALPKVRVDLGKPLIILAAKNEKTLRTLLPEYWERKHGFRPAGLFVAGQEKLYVALRTDTYGEFPYSIIYHEYVHALVNLNLQRIPVWLNEGLAEFYAHTVLEKKEVGLGRPDPNALTLLQREKPLPLNVLFAVGHGSPYYNENDKASILYAQSWALVHYLMFDDMAKGSSRLPQYLDYLASGLDPTEAAQRSFGDLKQLEKSMYAYVRQDTFKYVRMKAPAQVDENQFPARPLTVAESAAIRGDFHAHRNRPAEARVLLEEAIRLDPNNALAHESMGLLHLHQQDLEGAAKWFDRAAELDTRSYLALYYSATMEVSKSGPSGAPGGVESKLLRALELNPNFAPAHSTLANVYQFREETREKALFHARRATELEPGAVYHRINLANVLLNLRRLDEAIAMAQSAMASAKSDGERQAAQFVAQNAVRFKQLQEETARMREEFEALPESQRPALARRTLPNNPEAEGPTVPVLEPKALKLTGKRATATGSVGETVCGPAAFDLTLDRPGGKLRFHSPNFFRLDFMYYGGWEPPSNFQPCKHLANLRVRVTYKVAEDAAYAGEMTLIEILRP